MEVGFLNTILKQNAKANNGTWVVHVNPRKRGWANKKSSWCSFFFWPSGDRAQRICAFRTNYQPTVLPRSLGTSQKKGLLVCDRALQTIGCCTMTTLLVTRHCQSSNFWQQKGFQFFSNPRIHRFESLRLLPVPKTEIHPQGTSFRDNWEHSEGRNRPAKRDFSPRVPALFWRVGAASPTVCSFRRGPLWRGSCKYQ